MTPKLRLVEDAAESRSDARDRDTGPVPAPRRFERRLETPPALPWRQRQMAELEARLVAPAPIEQLGLTLSRAEPWRPGQVGVFNALYVHAGEGRARPSASPLAWLLPQLGQRGPERQIRSAPVLALLAVLAVVLPYLGINHALAIRESRAESLSSLDQQVATASRRAKRAARLSADTALLDQVWARPLGAAQMLDDLAWLSAHRRPQVIISAIHWAHGVSAVETSSATPPFDAPDRRQERAPRPLRPGVWLWGVATSPGAAR